MESLQKRCCVCLNHAQNFEEETYTIRQDKFHDEKISTNIAKDDCKTVKDQLPVIFLLRNLLEIPQQVCIQFLQDYGNPLRWVSYCHPCSILVDKARNVFHQMTLLQKQYKQLQTELKDAILVSMNSPESEDCDDLEEGSEIVRLYINNLTYQEPIASVSRKDEYTEGFELSIGEELKRQNYKAKEDVLHANRRKQNLKLLVEDMEPEKVTTAAEVENNSCLECNIVFLSAEDLMKHTKKTHKIVKPNHSCSFCLKSFSTGVALAIHMKMHTRATEFKCQFCSGYFLTSGLLKIHIIRAHKGHSEEKQHRCIICAKKFKLLRNLKIHEMNHIKDSSIHCKTCGKEFSTATGLELHARTHIKDGRSPFTCSICNEELTSGRKLKSHMKEMHRKETKCKICGKSFDEGKNMLRHIARKHPDFRTENTPHKCTFCDKSYTQRASLERHILANHKNPLTKNKPYKCKFCNNSFSTKTGLKVHASQMHSQTKSIPFACEICNTRCTSAKSLRNHERVKHCMIPTLEDKKYKCKICGERCVSSVRLQTHNKQYHGSGKVYECEACKKGFDDSDALKRHLKIHGIWPDKCKVCGMMFRDPNMLKIHLSTHAKTFKCEICGKEYAQKRSLNFHMKTHAAEKEPEFEGEVSYTTQNQFHDTKEAFILP